MSEITSQNETGVASRRPRKLRVTNSSGYPGVVWHKGARKWTATIRRNGQHQYIGLFATPKAAHAAYVAADERFSRPEPTRDAQVAEFLAAVRARYEADGLKALSYRALAEAGLRGRMQKLGLLQADLLRELGLEAEFEGRQSSLFTYRGVEKPRWTWERVVLTARALLADQGDLPTIPWCRRNGHSHLVNVVFQTGHTWEQLREAVGLPPSARFFQSRSGIRWRSRPEACLSNFLHARGVEHQRGGAYPAGYAEQSGRVRAYYDMHFRAADGRWVAVEVWGNLSGDHFGGERYSETRRLKEAWNSAHNPDFLGIDHGDCLSDARLEEHLSPYIGIATPIRVQRREDGLVETAHWSSADELLDTCRQIAALAPGGVFPSDEWLRKRGKFADREGPAYNSVSAYVQRWLGGTRKVRELLGQGHASTTRWDAAEVKAAWKAFEQKHGMSPQRAIEPLNRRDLPLEAGREASRIWSAANRLKVKDAVLGIRQGPKISWTSDRVIGEWLAFCDEHGCQPTECMSASKRARLPKEVCTRATRVYSAASRLGLLKRCRTV